jgi:hypothetical protein
MLKKFVEAKTFVMNATVLFGILHLKCISESLSDDFMSTVCSLNIYLNGFLGVSPSDDTASLN